MNKIIDLLTQAVRQMMYQLALGINKLTAGKVTPNMITLFGLFMHFPIAYLIARQYSWQAALLLVIFGLFDALDGAMAKVQHKSSNAGMLLDASTDRMKEVLLYCGAAYGIIASTGRPYLAVWAVAACGASLCVSYIKSKAETAIKDAKLSANEVNKLFADGIFRFQVRMLVLVVGLVSNRLALAVIVIAVASSLTAIGRLIRLSRTLQHV